MHPTISIGSFSFSSFYAVVIFCVIVGNFLTWWEIRRNKLDVMMALKGAVITTFMGYVGARAMHIVFDGFLDIYIQKPLAIFAVWKGGLAFYGTVIFGLPTAVWWFTKNKAPLMKYLDCYILGLAFGLGIGRFACYFNGCCFGEISASPFAETFLRYGLSAKSQFARDILLNLKDLPLPVLPTQLVSAFATTSIFLVLWCFFRKRKKKDGTLIALWLTMYATFRFTIEFFRSDERGLFFNNTLSTSQLVAIATFLIGMAIFILPSETAQTAEKTE